MKVVLPDVFVVADNIISPLGVTTAENFAQLKKGNSGIKLHQNNAFATQPFYAALFDKESAFQFSGNAEYTRFEQLLIASIADTLKQSSVNPADKRTLLIISTTKGNISLLETEEYNQELQKRMALTASAKLVAGHFGFVNQPLIISNACISGIMAMVTGARLIRAGQYDNVVIAGADVISKFILSGFQAFQAISTEPCKPFDLNRDGITLGEGAAAVILSATTNSPRAIKVGAGAISNDANHLSAPSRTGEELAAAIKKSLGASAVAATAIDFISAHGTATIYNDEMEAKAINLAGMQNVPVNSLKGYYGHTLGAAGLIESVISIQSLKENLLIPTSGFKETGTTQPLNIYTGFLPGNFKACLKTASGFGGCNAAILFTKQ